MDDSDDPIKHFKRGVRKGLSALDRGVKEEFKKRTKYIPDDVMDIDVDTGDAPQSQDAHVGLGLLNGLDSIVLYKRLLEVY